MVAGDELALFSVLTGLLGNWPETERIHHGEGPGAHGEDVAENAADAGSRALEGLDVAGVVVGLDFEGAGPAIAHVDDAGVLSGTLDNAVALGGQPLEVHSAGLVGAVFAPHHAVNAKLSEGWDAAQRRQDASVLIRGDAV